jgi:sarcosine oxidase subunit gamma
MSSDQIVENFNDILQETLICPDEETCVDIQGVTVQYSLRIKKEDLAAFKKNSGWNLPSKIGGSLVTRNYSAFCLGPDEWQLITDTGKIESTRKKLEKLAKKFVFSYADVSHRNVTFNLTGPMALSMINIGCPLDMSLTAFPIDKCTRTVFENAEIMILRTAEDAFAVQTWRSFGPYLVGFFKKFAREMG